MTETQCLVVLCTCPDGAPAARLAETLVAERLAACVNRLAGVVSNFRWEGQVQHVSETLLVIKTTRAGLAALTARIIELHPYELPEILAVPVVGGHGPYLEWLQAGVARPGDA